MLSSLTIEGYKKFHYLELPNLGNFNLFVGDNNMGKTTILEAVFAWASGLNINAILPNIAQKNSLNGNPYSLAENIYFLANDRKKNSLEIVFKGICDDEVSQFSHKIDLNGIFLGNDSVSNEFLKHTDEFSKDKSSQVAPVNISLPMINNPQITVAEWKITSLEGNSVSRRVTIPELFVQDISPYKLASYMDLLVHRNSFQINSNFSKLKRSGLLDELVARMQKLFPEVAGIDMIPYPDGSSAPISVKTKNGEFIPLRNFGDGFQKWFYIMSTTILYKDSILCIDEIDGNLHHKAQSDFCRNLMEYARNYNVQVFATTHNLEFMDCLLQEYVKIENAKNDYNVNVITLKNVKGATKIRCMNGKEAYEMRREFNMELR